ncbi:MAG: GNAT family N-acetyltransferase [Alphaproteobacteria bacterium]|nr:GNAT family N-acetyltransferase [Alphaproteobacteria bacterium]
MKNLVERNRFSFQLFKSPEPLETAWRALESAPETSIHQTYDWCRIWIEESGCDPLIILATFQDGDRHGETAFILPLMVVRHGPVTVARYMSAPFNNINFGLFSSAFAERATRELMSDIKEQLVTQKLGVDVIVLDRQPKTWRGRTHPFALLSQVENQNHAFQVSLSGGFDAALAHGNAKRRRKKFRTSERRMEAMGGYQYVRAKTAEEARELLDVFFRQKSARFEFQGLPDVFAASTTKSFFHRLAAESIGKEFALIELHALRMADGSVSAVSALSRKNGHVICQFSSIESGEIEYASPGELLFYLVIQDACEHDAVFFDFGIGDEQFKRSWCDVETIHYDTIIAATAFGRLAAPMAQMIVAGKRITKSNPAMFRWAKLMRISFHR